LKQACPTLSLVKAIAAVGTVVWIGAVAVRIGIAKTDNMLFHFDSSPLSVFPPPRLIAITEISGQNTADWKF
jgi:hypothetical protein